MSDTKQKATAATRSGQAETSAGEAASPAIDTTEVPLKPSRYTAQERVMLACVVVAIAIALGFMGWYVREHATVLLPRALQPLARKTGLIPSPTPMEVAKPIGSPTAKVRVAVIMEHCLVPVQDLLVSVGKEYPDLVHAEFYPSYTPEAQKVMQECQESCAGVFINGKNRFQVALPGAAPKEVYFHAMPGAGYQLTDVTAVLKQEMEAAYGSAPADFDQRVVVPKLPPRGPDLANPDAPPGAAPGGPATGSPPAPDTTAPAAH